MQAMACKLASLVWPVQPCAQLVYRLLAHAVAPTQPNPAAQVAIFLPEKGHPDSGMVSCSSLRPANRRHAVAEPSKVELVMQVDWS